VKGDEAIRGEGVSLRVSYNQNRSGLAGHTRRLMLGGKGSRDFSFGFQIAFGSNDLNDCIVRHALLDLGEPGRESSKRFHRGDVVYQYRRDGQYFHLGVEKNFS
jgi:hypothetical protein